MSSLPSPKRALPPVIGVALLAALVRLLWVVTAVVVFGLVEEREPAPELSMSLEDYRVAIERRLVHEQGQQLDSDRVEVRGVADPETISAGDGHGVIPIVGTIRAVWLGTDGTSYIVREASVDPAFDVPSADVGCPWIANESNDGVDPVTASGTVVVDTESEPTPVKVLSSDVSGDVASGDSATLQDETVLEAVCVGGIFDCTNPTVN